MQSLGCEWELWEPLCPMPVEAGALDVFWVEERSTASAGLQERGGHRGIRAVLARVLNQPESETVLSHDRFGRPQLQGSPFGLCLCRDDGRLIVALAHGMSVAVSAHTVPEALGDAALLAFDPAERRLLNSAPEQGVPRLAAQLWTRKEAALRLAGPGMLALAGETRTLPGAHGGEVVLPGGQHGPRSVQVRDLPTGDGGWVASAATSAPVRTVRAWRLTHPESEPVMG
ncbi:4'-phosphopantetheinyl transferase family protein [Streptomyces noursei]|uniref:4'-phosphopantetheinyl transferase family protein n=1 Tax=Streptomyces noursei TaxID=1971 RepID=UPI0019654A15|nr:4'-phosphopantetheinyl transferase family protein [Streptomyces noursei]QRX94981.1 4'-phosphopantetheinyl transferase superfamily protein [Streptomyces noursei]